MSKVGKLNSFVYLFPADEASSGKILLKTDFIKDEISFINESYRAMKFNYKCYSNMAVY